MNITSIQRVDKVSLILIRNENHIIHVMLFYIVFQLIQHGTRTNKSEYDLSAIGSLGTRLEPLHDLDQSFKVIVQTDIARVHDDKLAIQTILFLESRYSLVIRFQRVNLVLIDPVVNHDSFRNFLTLESSFYRLNQISANRDDQVTSFAAELVEPHHSIGHKFALGIANGQHLFRVEVLNVVNVLSVFYPLAPDTQQAAKDRRLGNGEHIILLSDLEGCAHRSKEVGNNVLHTAFLIGFAELRHPDSQYLHAVDFFFVILLCLIFIFNGSQIARNYANHCDVELIQHTLRQFTENLPR